MQGLIVNLHINCFLSWLYFENSHIFVSSNKLCKKGVTLNHVTPFSLKLNYAVTVTLAVADLISVWSVTVTSMFVEPTALAVTTPALET